MKIEREKVRQHPGVEKSDLTFDQIEKQEQSPNEPLNVNEIKYNNSKKLSGDYIRVEIPSHFVPYKEKELFIRPLRGRDLNLLYQGAKEGKFSLVVDAINNTIEGMDARDLSVQDFTFLLYYQKILSFKKMPFNYPWISRYGDKLVHTISNSNLEIKEFKLSEAEYKIYQDLGIKIPTVRDQELTQDETIDSKDEFLLHRAQYIAKGNTLRDKLEILNDSEIEFFETLKEFSEIADHGVKDTVKLFNDEFNPEKAVIFLREEFQRLIAKADASGVKETNPDIYYELIEGLKNDLLGEADEIEQKLIQRQKSIDAGISEEIEIKPREETVEIKFNLTRFFSDI